MSYVETFQEKISEVICTVAGRTMTYDAMINYLAVFFKQVRKERRMVYFIGNGGSAGIAIHMTGDFLKNGSMRTHSMYDAATITCLGNDFGYEDIFSKQIECVADAGDVLVAISSSGNSQNILQAVQTARNMNCKVVTLSGFRADNVLRSLGDCNIYVPVEQYGIVESIHNMILQQVVDELVGA